MRSRFDYTNYYVSYYLLYYVHVLFIISGCITRTKNVHRTTLREQTSDYLKQEIILYSSRNVFRKFSSILLNLALLNYYIMEILFSWNSSCFFKKILYFLQYSTIKYLVHRMRQIERSNRKVLIIMNRPLFSYFSKVHMIKTVEFSWKELLENIIFFNKFVIR